MKRPGVLGVVVVLAAVAAGGLPVTSASAASPSSPSGWAVVIENNSFGGRYPDLPVAYANSTRMLTALIRRGWPADHILLVRDSVDRNLLAHTLAWLAVRVHPGDTALVYIAGEYQFLDRDLKWGATFPALWNAVPTSRRVLIAETCFAERLTVVVKNIPGLALPAVGRNEWDVWGLRQTDRIIQGGAFTYFLTRALEKQPQDLPPAFGAAFTEAVANAQAYFRTVIFSTRGVLDSFHAVGEHPERLATFPNPHLSGSDDESSASALGTIDLP